MNGSNLPGFLSEGGTGSLRSRNKTKKLSSGHQLQDATGVPVREHTRARIGPILSVPSGPAPDLPGTPEQMPCYLSEELSRFLLEVESERDQGLFN